MLNPTPSYRTPPGKSALHWAAAVNNVEATLALLKNGANKDMQDSKVSSEPDPEPDPDPEPGPDPEPDPDPGLRVES